MADKTAAERIAEKWFLNEWGDEEPNLARDIQQAIDVAVEESGYRGWEWIKRNVNTKVVLMGDSFMDAIRGTFDEK